MDQQLQKPGGRNYQGEHESLAEQAIQNSNKLRKEYQKVLQKKEAEVAKQIVNTVKQALFTMGNTEVKVTKDEVKRRLRHLIDISECYDEALMREAELKEQVNRLKEARVSDAAKLAKVKTELNRWVHDNYKENQYRRRIL